MGIKQLAKLLADEAPEVIFMQAHFITSFIAILYLHSFTSYRHAASF
jgi:hypothetical protein